MPHWLQSEDAFLAWLTATFQLEACPSISARTNAVLDDLATFRLIRLLEQVTAEDFPIDLLMEIRSIGDWYYFAATKAGHRRAVHPQ